MKNRIQLLLMLAMVFFSITISNAQCNLEQTIIVCNIETIDFDGDTNPDGIINLYTQTGTTPADGVWSVTPIYDITLDSDTGDVFTWEFFEATQNDTLEEYQFQLFNASCGTDPAITVFLQIGPFSGVAAPQGVNGANVEICSESDFDLYEILVSNATTPAPHQNGVWEFIGIVGDPVDVTFELEGSRFEAEIPYEEGIPLIDSNIFELRYVVEGESPCAPESETIVRVSVVRQVDAGVSELVLICESDILAGLYDADINLRDDIYLSGEDVEGYWLADEDGTGQLENENDSMINIREIYDQFITDNGSNLRFGCETASFRYFVPKRSSVCFDDFQAVSIKVLEELRPFQEIGGDTEVCNNVVEQFNLFSLLEFTNQNGIDFRYSNDRYVNWRLVSGDSDLGLIPQPDLFSDFENIDYHLGAVNTFGAVPGTYVFEYGVAPEINCQLSNQEVIDPFVTDVNDLTYSQSPCETLMAQVTITILNFDYPGESTDDVIICDSSAAEVDLFTLLNSTEPINTGGIWTDQDDSVILNPFIFPVVNDSIAFDFTYTTTSLDNCEAFADLSFKLFATANAGIDGAETLCSDNLTINLFDLLSGDPDTTGTWVGPFGYQSDDYLGMFDMDDFNLPVLGEGTYTYTVTGNRGCPANDQSEVVIVVVDPVPIGNDRFDTFCKIDGSVNLFSILDNDTPRNGQFEDTDNTNQLTVDAVFEFGQLTATGNEQDTYQFRYTIPATLPCDEQSLIVSVQIVDLPEPVVPVQEFCILDAKRLDDIEVDVVNYNWYETLESDSPITDSPLLFDNDIFYIANVDANNCESERVMVAIEILNLGEQFSNGDICTLNFQDGVSPDGNNQNDSFLLTRDDEVQKFNIPEAFPDYDLKIYNRYGTLVFQGNINTGEFRGQSNVSLRLGDDLPSGTYFYIFTPNFENNLPIQGSFYLSR